MAVTVEVKATGGVKWWLIQAGGELSRQSVATQTVKLTLEPVMFDSSGHPMDEIFIEAGEQPVHSEPLATKLAVLIRYARDGRPRRGSGRVYASAVATS